MDENKGVNFDDGPGPGERDTCIFVYILDRPNHYHVGM